MGLLNSIRAAVSHLRQPSEPKSTARLTQNHVSRFRVEQLEPRILLSGDLVPQADISASVQNFDNSAIVLIRDQQPTEYITLDFSAWETKTTETRNLKPDTFDAQPSTLDTPNLTPETLASEALKPLVNQAVDQLSNLGFSS